MSPRTFGVEYDPPCHGSLPSPSVPTETGPLDSLGSQGLTCPGYRGTGTGGWEPSVRDCLPTGRKGTGVGVLLFKRRETLYTNLCPERPKSKVVGHSPGIYSKSILEEGERRVLSGNRQTSAKDTRRTEDWEWRGWGVVCVCRRLDFVTLFVPPGSTVDYDGVPEARSLPVVHIHPKTSPWNGSLVFTTGPNVDPFLLDKGERECRGRKRCTYGY